MKAVVFHEYGGLDKLSYEDVEMPKVKHGEVLLRVKASALNHIDIWGRMGGVPLPHIAGSDIAGEVVEPDDENRFQIGDKVIVFPAISCGRCEPCIHNKPTQCASRKLIGFHTDGGYAEYVKVPANNLFPMPLNLSFEEAAALPLSASTAWHMLVTKGEVKPTTTVLIHGAGSGVSTYAIQIGKLFGAKVIATTSSDEKTKKAFDIGASNVINYKDCNVAEEVMRITKGRGVDLVIDHVGAATFNISLNSLRRGGKIVLAGVTSGKEMKIDLQHLYREEVIIEGSYLFEQGEFSSVIEMAKERRLKPIVSEVFQLKDASKAQQAMEEAKHFGKIILKNN